MALRSKRTKFLLLLIILGVCAVLLFIRYRQDILKTYAGGREELYQVTYKPARQTLLLSGKIQADEKATLRFQAAGRLSWIGVKVGDRVEKFQSLASLDTRDVKKTLQKKLNLYMSERWDFEQSQDDYDINGAQLSRVTLTDEEKRVLEKAQFGLDNTVLDVELADLAREYSLLFTPIAGLVTRVDAPYAGMNITPATAEIEIINPQSIYFSVTADQSEVVNLKISQPADMILDSFPDTTISGTIKDIGFTPISGETGTVYEVKVSLPQDATMQLYRMDMTGDAQFVIKENPSVLLVPLSVINSQDGEKFVYINSENKKVKKIIRTGIEYDDMVEVTAGLVDGDLVYD